jgi:hypothetical protein
MLTQLARVQYEKAKWWILHNPANPIVKYLIWRRSIKLAEELMKEFTLIKESLEECGYETEELEEIFGFGKKKTELTPDQAIEAGKKKLDSDVVLKGALRKQQPKDMNKFLMSLGFNPEIKYRKWDANMMAPDGTKGYYVDSTVYSGQGSGGNTSMSAE